ncbi:hypothetical protein LCGC14_0431450 [marine sediment metagenome]|uniref:Holin n=1 Tax=marine sediment metagenome TaxID=412755 RepID=A0A0F9SN49_9ZZZZ
MKELKELLKRWVSDTNDLIALFLLILIIPGMWIADATDILNLSGQIEGATIMGWTLVLQFYFRRRKPK